MSETTWSRTREFVARHTDGVAVEDDEDLFDSGYANSLFVVQLVMWIERTFDLTIARGDLVLDNFRTIAAIVAFIDAHAGAVQEAEQAWISG